MNLLQYTGMKGGMETYIQQLYRQLGRMDTGYEFVGFASKELAAMDHSWFPGEVVDSGISGENRFTWAYGELFAVSRAARKAGADLIHGPSMFGPLRSKVPAVVTIHDLLYFSNPELMSTPLYTEPVKWMEKRGAANARHLITISEFSADAIRRYLGVPDAKLDVIPLAGTPNQHADTGVTREPDLFLAVGQRRPHKNFETILRAFAAMPEERRPRLVITGSYAEDPLAPLVAELGLERWVTLKGWIEKAELDDLFARATALVDATLVTGFSLPTLEAMMIGLPVVLSDIPIFREVGGDAARYFPAQDPRALADLLLRLTESPAELAEMTAQGHAWVERFSWERTARETVAVFDRVLGR